MGQIFLKTFHNHPYPNMDSHQYTIDNGMPMVDNNKSLRKGISSFNISISNQLLNELSRADPQNLKTQRRWRAFRARGERALKQRRCALAFADFESAQTRFQKVLKLNTAHRALLPHPKQALNIGSSSVYMPSATPELKWSLLDLGRQWTRKNA